MIKTFRTMSLWVGFLALSILGNAQAADKKILILGDSLTYGLWVKPADAFPAQLQNKLIASGITDVRIISAGVSGALTATGLPRLQNHLQQEPGLTSLVLELGANDGLQMQDLAAAKQNLKSTIELALQNRLSVLVLGLKLPLNYPQAYREAFERMYLEVTQETQTLLLPYFLEGVGGVPEYNVADGLHPNEAGHRIVTETIYPYLLQLL